jgi:nitrite reductase/ring-hydroxylating ferredoxin subunit
MPENDRDPEQPGLSRRAVLKSLPVVAIGAGLGLSLGGCGGASIPRTTVVFGPPDELALGTPRRLEAYDVYLVRTEQGIAAISGRCTHAGCGVTPVDGGAFHCGCHGSDFAADGTVTNGPARTDLPWFAVRIEDGNVVVDPAQEVAKGTYTPIGGEAPPADPLAEEPATAGDESVE